MAVISFRGRCARFWNQRKVTPPSLHLLDALPPERPAKVLQQSRAVQLLEMLGSAEASQLLQELAQGAPEARLTQEAKASLERLAKRRLDGR